MWLLFAGSANSDPPAGSTGCTREAGEGQHQGSSGSEDGSGGSYSGSDAGSTISGTYGSGTRAARNARAQARTGWSPAPTADAAHLRGKFGPGAVDWAAAAAQSLFRHVAARFAAPSYCLLVLLLSHWSCRRFTPGHEPGHAPGQRKEGSVFDLPRNDRFAAPTADGIGGRGGVYIHTRWSLQHVHSAYLMTC